MCRKTHVRDHGGCTSVKETLGTRSGDKIFRLLFQKSLSEIMRFRAKVTNVETIMRMNSFQVTVSKFNLITLLLSR